jgi:small subunit ribosomal protein S5
MENIEKNNVTPKVDATTPKKVEHHPKANTTQHPVNKSSVNKSESKPALTEPKPRYTPSREGKIVPPGSRTFPPRGERKVFPPRPGGAGPSRDGARAPFNRDNRSAGGFGNNSKFGNKSNSKFGPRKDMRKPLNPNEPEMFAEVITVRRVTRVVKGGKRMRFAALVVVGDKKGSVGFANRKGMDFQDAVAKATKKAKENTVKIKMNEDMSLPFSTVTKFKAAQVLLKPAKAGTSLIAGGYVRPVLELVGIKNVYSKILGSSNKVVGVEAVINALKNYQ